MQPPRTRIECTDGVRRQHRSSHGASPSAAMMLTAKRVGYLVPVPHFEGTVHSTFARACNIACGATLLTVAVDELADGPTTIKLAPGAVPDLRGLFRTGQQLRCRY